MITALNLQICQVLEPESDHTLFDKFQDPESDPPVDLPPMSIRVRIRGKFAGGSSEAWAIPGDPTMLQVPLYGEQVLCYSAVDGNAEKTKQQRMFYINLVNAHGIVNNTIMPFIQDARVSGRSYSSDGISKVSPGAEPKQVSFEEKAILPIQPFQGDIMFKRTKGYSGGGTYDPYYKIEEPNDDKSFIYLTTKQKLERFDLAQEGIGVDPEPEKLKDYKESQVIIGSERIIFNAKKHSIILVSAKDIKFCVPDWQIDANRYWTQIIEPWLQICVDLASGESRYATPAGPTGASDALPKLQEIQKLLEEMKQG